MADQDSPAAEIVVTCTIPAPPTSVGEGFEGLMAEAVALSEWYAEAWEMLRAAVPHEVFRQVGERLRAIEETADKMMDDAGRLQATARGSGGYL